MARLLGTLSSHGMSSRNVTPSVEYLVVAGGGGGGKFNNSGAAGGGGAGG